MGSRIRNRKSVKHLFDCFIVILEPGWKEEKEKCRGDHDESQKDMDMKPTIRSVFPSTFNDQEILKSAAQFTFPCVTQSENVELFTFVLTSGDSKWTFGYCRHPPGGSSCSVFLSSLPWQEIFYRTLNFCAEIDESHMEIFLKSMYSTPIPEASTCLYVPTELPKPFICPCPGDLSLPSIPENRNVSEFYNALGTDSMITLFAALLSERRIVVTSKKLSRLSSIVIACNLFLFPMSWQHIFIPVLPSQLYDYLAAPMPFLIGVPISVWDRIPPETLGQIVRVDADTDTITSPFPEDLDCMPLDIVSSLKKNLSGERVLGDGLARAFLRALAQLMGHYQDAIVDGGQSFDQELFIQFARPSHRAFIQDKLLLLQIFQQFMEERLERVKAGSCESDEFELESLAWRSSNANSKNGMPGLKNIAGSQNRTAIKKAGKAVIMSVKREGGNLIETVKQNSTLKLALRSVKEGGKNVKHKSHVAYSDIRSKLQTSSPSTKGGERAGSKSPSQQHPGHTQNTKTYRRYSGANSNDMPQVLGGNNLKLHRNSQIAHTSMGSLDDNLVHLTSSSSSSAKLSDFVPERVQPRLSKSEENLIDLDTPDSLQLGFTLENPLYDLVANNSVFEDSFKTDDQLLQEYGLNEYFTQLNVSGAAAGTGSEMEINNSSSASAKSKNLHQPSAAANSKWTTFE